MRRAIWLTAGGLAVVAGRAGAQTGRVFEFRKIREDIYHAAGTGVVGTGSNAVVVVNGSDVLLVDSHVSPRAATALLRELKQITPKPVKYVVNTHFHYDHVHGNQVYPPDVEIIGHEFTRAMIASGRSRSGPAYQSYTDMLRTRTAGLARAMDSTRDPGKKAELATQLARYRAEAAADRAVRPTPPNVTVSERVTLFRGGREIQIIFSGRGHTGGDVVVYLPREKVLATGDLLQARLPYMGDGYPEEWVATLEKLKRLDFDIVLPGHGTAFTDRSAIDHLQDFLRDFWRQAVAMHQAGVDVKTAARRMDIARYAPFFPQMADTADTYDRLEGGLTRAYQLLSGESR